LALLTIIPADGLNIASARTRKGASSNVSKASRSSKERSSKRTRRHQHRSYTVRGNPDVTRKVATETIRETLPELAALVGLPAADSPSPMESSTPVALTGTKELYANDTYQDSELDDKEDDPITAEDEEDLEDLPTDINSFYKEFTSYMASLNGGEMVTDNGVDKQVVMQTLVDWLGTRYLFGGMGRNGIDCSAFTGMMYRTINYPLPRTAAAQWEVGSAVERDQLQFGDLVFFHTRQAVYVSHVGIYLGNNMFAHASSRNGVTVSSLNADYYTSHFIGGRRYNVNAVASTSTTVSSALSSY
jgi:cell wall-associated NlpC family hydrolase